MSTVLSAEQLLDVAGCFHTPFETGELSFIDEHLAPEWRNRPRNPNEAIGREGWKGTVGRVHSVFGDIAFTVEDAFIHEDKVVLRTVARAHHTGPLGPMPASGRAVAFTALEIHRFAGEKIVESFHLQDYYGLMAQLEAVPNVMGAAVAPYPAWDLEQ